MFLIALASAKRVSELQALSWKVSFSSSAAAVSYVPEFMAKTESALRPLPRSLRFSLSLILWPAYLKTCYYVLSRPFRVDYEDT